MNQMKGTVIQMSVLSLTVTPPKDATAPAGLNVHVIHSAGTDPR